MREGGGDLCPMSSIRNSPRFFTILQETDIKNFPEMAEHLSFSSLISEDEPLNQQEPHNEHEPHNQHEPLNQHEPHNQQDNIQFPITTR